MQAILDLMSAMFTFLFVHMDGAAGTADGAISAFIAFILGEPLLTIPIALGLVVTVIAFYRKVKTA